MSEGIWHKYKRIFFHRQSLFPMPTLHDIKKFSADFEQKSFAHFLKRLADFRAKRFCSKSAEMKILLCNVGMGNKLYGIFFFDLCVKNWSLWSKFTSSKKVLWFFSKGLRFRILLTFKLQVLSYPNPLSAIMEDFFFQLGSNLIKYVVPSLNSLCCIEWYHWYTKVAQSLLW